MIKKEVPMAMHEMTDTGPYSRWHIGMADDLGFLVTIDVEPHQQQPAGRFYLSAEEARYVAWRLQVHAEACERLNAKRSFEADLRAMWGFVGGKEEA